MKSKAAASKRIVWTEKPGENDQYPPNPKVKPDNMRYWGPMAKEKK